jgi:hypothetical protein
MMILSIDINSLREKEKTDVSFFSPLENQNQ